MGEESGNNASGKAEITHQGHNGGEQGGEEGQERQASIREG